MPLRAAANLVGDDNQRVAGLGERVNIREYLIINIPLIAAFVKHHIIDFRIAMANPLG